MGDAYCCSHIYFTEHYGYPFGVGSFLFSWFARLSFEQDSSQVYRGREILDCLRQHWAIFLDELGAVMGLLNWIFGAKNNEYEEHLIESAFSAIDGALGQHEIKLESVYVKIKSFQERAKREIREGNKEGAKLTLRRKKLYEEDAKRLSNHMFALEAQRVNISSSISVKDFFEKLCCSKNAVDQMKLNKEDVEQLTDNLKQQKLHMHEVNDLLTEGNDDDNDVEKTVAEEISRKEESDLLQELSRLPMISKTKIISTRSDTHAAQPEMISTKRDAPAAQSAISTSRDAHAAQPVPVAVSPQASSKPEPGLTSLANKPMHERKSYVYADVVKKLNSSREQGLPFNPAVSFKVAYESLGIDLSPGNSVNVQKLWQLIQAMTGEYSAVRHGVSKRMSLVIGARRHLECRHERHIMEIIRRNPIQADLGISDGNLQRIRAYIQIDSTLKFNPSSRLRAIDTTWKQIYLCLRTGYYEEAIEVARSSQPSQQKFSRMLSEWITTGGTVNTAASNECENFLSMGSFSRQLYDKKKLLLYAIISGSRRQIDCILKELPMLFNTIEDLLWFRLSCIRDAAVGFSSVAVNDKLVPCSLDDLQAYLNKYEPSHYTKNGKDPLLYPYVLLLSIQLVPAIMHMSKEAGDEGYNIDAVHIAISLADHTVLSEGSGTRQKLIVMDANAEASSIIRQYGMMYSHHGGLQMTLEYYAQAAAAVGGGQLAWSGRSNADQRRQRDLMLKQLLTEILLREGGINFLLGARGSGEEGELGRFLPDSKLRHQFLMEAVHHCQEARLYNKCIEIEKRL